MFTFIGRLIWAPPWSFNPVEPKFPQVASRSPKNTPQSQGSLHKAWGGSTAPCRVESGGSRIPNLGKNIKNIILPILKNPTNNPNTVPVSQYKGITVPAADPPVFEFKLSKISRPLQVSNNMDFYKNYGLMEGSAPAWGGPGPTSGAPQWGGPPNPPATTPTPRSRSTDPQWGGSMQEQCPRTGG